MTARPRDTAAPSTTTSAGFAPAAALQPAAAASHGHGEGQALISPGWWATLEALEADLRARAAAPKTARAYLSDCATLARWGTARGVTPEDVDAKALRRYLAGLSQRGQAPTTIARKLASMRALFSVQACTRQA